MLHVTSYNNEYILANKALCKKVLHVINYIKKYILKKVSSNYGLETVFKFSKYQSSIQRIIVSNKNKNKY